MWVLAGIGAVLAGLFLMLRELLPAFEAGRTGVIRSKGAAAIRIERAAEPERFEAMRRGRFRAARFGIGLAAAGMLWTILQIVGIALNQAG